MTVRFVYRDHGTPGAKDRVVRGILVRIAAVLAAGLAGTGWLDRYGRTDSERGGAPA